MVGQTIVFCRLSGPVVPSGESGSGVMDFKDQLKSSVDIVNVVGEYVRLRKSGPQRYSGLCPFHTEKTPSFSVHAARQFYKCFGCGEGGDVFNFVQKIEGISFYEALKLLAERHGGDRQSTR